MNKIKICKCCKKEFPEEKITALWHSKCVCKKCYYRLKMGWAEL